MDDKDEPKFTPGPWHISDDMSDPVYITTARRKICSIDYNAPYDESDANAALIAVAPEMYGLLERLSHALYAEDGDRWAEEINWLLAKARGEVAE